MGAAGRRRGEKNESALGRQPDFFFSKFVIHLTPGGVSFPMSSPFFLFTYLRKKKCTLHDIFFYFNTRHWVTVKIGIHGLDPDLYRNKHRINPEYVEIE